MPRPESSRRTTGDLSICAQSNPEIATFEMRRRVVSSSEDLTRHSRTRRITLGTDAVIHRTNKQECRGSAIAAAAEARRGVSRSGNRRARIRGGLAPWRARRLVAHIDARLGGRVAVAELARLAGVSNGHFVRAFKQTFGVSPRTFLRRRRIELAQGIMLRTDLTLSEIALRCGLFDQPHLSKMFRSVVGETPSAWRRARTGCCRGAELRYCSGARDLFRIGH